jgi:hypothetical protein
MKTVVRFHANNFVILELLGGKLGELYVEDNRYTPVNGLPSKELALFIKEATDHYIKSQQQYGIRANSNG